MEQIGELPPPLPIHLKQDTPPKDKLKSVLQNKRLSTNRIIRNSILFQDGKLFKVPRDYSTPDVPKFEMQFPPMLAQKIPPETFYNTIDTINRIISQGHGEKLKDIFTFFLDIASCYTYTQCCKNDLYKAAEQVSKFIEQQNMDVYYPIGWCLRDPTKSGFLYVSCI
ncbi:hypothetical protein K502DRAFT_285781 [Neoconidiobolus thromboides FSU 785]|nr:hypothetical protein K502DRAFT_285781 [Neoconidiobolus thromboides FSU 785]